MHVPIEAPRPMPTLTYVRGLAAVALVGVGGDVMVGDAPVDIGDEEFCKLEVAIVVDVAAAVSDDPGLGFAESTAGLVAPPVVVKADCSCDVVVAPWSSEPIFGQSKPPTELMKNCSYTRRKCVELMLSGELIGAKSAIVCVPGESVQSPLTDSFVTMEYAGMDHHCTGEFLNYCQPWLRGISRPQKLHCSRYIHITIRRSNLKYASISTIHELRCTKYRCSWTWCRDVDDAGNIRDDVCNSIAATTRDAVTIRQTLHW